MQILKRVLRICKADIHGMIDQLEDQEFLLKQYLRDMTAALEQKDVQQKKMNLSRRYAAQKLESYNQGIEKIEQDLEVALKHDKDSIARLLIKKLKRFTSWQTEMEGYMDTLDREIAHLQDCNDQQRLQYVQLKQRATDFINQAQQPEWDASISDFAPPNISRELLDQEVELDLIQRKEARFQE